LVATPKRRKSFAPSPRPSDASPIVRSKKSSERDAVSVSTPALSAAKLQARIACAERPSRSAVSCVRAASSI